MPLGRLGQACEGRTVSSVFVVFQPEPPAGICRAAHVPRNSQATTSLFDVAHGCFDNTHMQELGSRFLELSGTNVVSDS